MASFCICLYRVAIIFRYAVVNIHNCTTQIIDYYIRISMSRKCNIWHMPSMHDVQISRLVLASQIRLCSRSRPFYPLFPYSFFFIFPFGRLDTQNRNGQWPRRVLSIHHFSGAIWSHKFRLVFLLPCTRPTAYSALLSLRPRFSIWLCRAPCRWAPPFSSWCAYCKVWSRVSHIRLAMVFGDFGHRHWSAPVWRHWRSAVHMQVLWLACPCPACLRSISAGRRRSISTQCAV